MIFNISLSANLPALLYIVLIYNNLKYPFKHKDSSLLESFSLKHPIQNEELHLLHSTKLKLYVQEHIT